YGKALEMASELRDFLMFHLGLVSLRHLLFPYLFLKTYNLLTLVSSVLTMQHLLVGYQLFRSDPKCYSHTPFLHLIIILSYTVPPPNSSPVQHLASASNGSPTRETTSKHERLYLFNASFPKLLNIRSAVGAVNSLFTRYLSII